MIAAATALSATALSAAGLFVGGSANAATYSTASIDTSSEASVAAAYQQLMYDASVPSGWNGNSAQCQAGSITQAARNANLDSINIFRAWVGESPATDPGNTAWNAVEQDRALAADAYYTSMIAGTLPSNTPQLTDLHQFTSGQPCLTSAYPSIVKNVLDNSVQSSGGMIGGAGAEGENAAYNSEDPSWSRPGGANMGYMSDAANTDAGYSPGHRFNLIQPGTVAVAVGATNQANYEYIDVSNSGSSPSSQAWPAAGYFPTELLPSASGGSGNGQTPWSYQSTAVDVDNAKVSLTVNGAPVTATNIAHSGNDKGSGGHNYYGQVPSDISWQPSTQPTAPGNGVSTYSVTLSNVTSYSGAPMANITYTVTLFNAASYHSGTPSTPTPTASNPSTCGNARSAQNGRFATGGFSLGTSTCSTNYFVSFQGDGNLVVYSSSGNVNTPVWSSGTAGEAAGGWLSIQTDGNLVIYAASGLPVWASNTRFIGGANGLGGYIAVQTDGNMVLYGNLQGSVTPIWSTK